MTNQSTLPVDLEAEQAVIGAVLIDPESIYRIGASLAADDFHGGRHAAIWAAMLALRDAHTPIDLVTLVRQLRDTDTLGAAGGESYLMELPAMVPTALYVDHYAAIVKEKADLRRDIAGLQQMAQLAYDPETTHDAFQSALHDWILESAKSGTTSMASMRDMMEAEMDRLDELARNPQPPGLPTGFRAIDGVLKSGMGRGHLIAIGARPGMGKTSLVLNVAERVARNLGARVAFFSLEMSKEELTQRMLSTRTHIDGHRIRSGDIYEEEWPILMEVGNVLAECPIFVDDRSNTIADIQTKARTLYYEHGLDLIIVDYLQLMDVAGRKENRTQEISTISRALKALARKLQVPVIALSQLNRGVEQRQDKRPMLSDLRESGQIEQDCDVVMFIYREDYYIEDTDRQNIADIIIAKNRHGSGGTVSLYFRKEFTEFHDMDTMRTELTS